MNCDQVFDILTRGPFPTGAASDGAVQRHLGLCPQCNELAEALRPALDLIHESVSPEESWGLPGYWDDAIPQIVPQSDAASATDQSLVALGQRERLAVRPVKPPLRRRPARRANPPAARSYLLASLAGICVALVVFFAQERGGGPAPLAAATVPIDWPPRQCRHDGFSAPDEPANLAVQLAACTTCHPAGQRHWLIRPATTTIAATCVRCHTFNSIH